MEIFKKIGDGFKDMKSDFESFFVEEALSNLLPKVRKFLPKIKQSAKEFFDKNDCIVIIKKEGDDVVASVLKVSDVEIKIKSKDSFVKTDEGNNMVFSVEQFSEIIMNDGIQKMISEHRAKKKNEG